MCPWDWAASSHVSEIIFSLAGHGRDANKNIHTISRACSWPSQAGKEKSGSFKWEEIKIKHFKNILKSSVQEIHLGERKTHCIRTKSEHGRSRQDFFSGFLSYFSFCLAHFPHFLFDVVIRIRKLFSFPNTRRDGKRAKGGKKVEYFWILRAKEAFFLHFFHHRSYRHIRHFMLNIFYEHSLCLW